jgi:hypothetical protein
MCTVAGVVAHLPPAFDNVLHHAESAQPLRVLCIGLGGGTLPLFISQHFPGAEVDVAEVDPVVVDAATRAMAFPADRLPCSVSHSFITCHISSVLSRNVEVFHSVLQAECLHGSSMIQVGGYSGVGPNQGCSCV